MTKAELIDFLNKNFADGEEVTFLYNDDGYDARGGIAEVKMDERTYAKQHFEVLENGKWVRYEGTCHPTRDYQYVEKWGHRKGWTVEKGWYREVIDKEWTDTKKCIVIA